MDLLLAWLKAVHVSALLLWSAGLICLPALLLAHGRVRDNQDSIRIRRASRLAHSAVSSPAAMIAIGAGTALLFVADALHGWMFVKLAFVGILVLGHLQFGYVLRKLADREQAPPRVRILAVLAVVLAVIPAILWLVLGEPELSMNWLPDWVLEPGGPQELFSLPTPT